MRPEDAAPPPSPGPATPPEHAGRGVDSWIQHSLNDLKSNLGDMDNRLRDDIGKIDDRLRKVETKIWIAIGVGIAITAIASFLGTIAWEVITTLLPVPATSG